MQSLNQKGIFREVASRRVENGQAMREHVGDYPISWFGDDHIDSREQVLVTALSAVEDQKISARFPVSSSR